MTTVNSQLNSIRSFLTEVATAETAFVIVGRRILDSGSGCNMKSRGYRTGTKVRHKNNTKQLFNQVNIAFQPF